VIGFDPDLERLQDWDVWLRLALKDGIKGIATHRVLFKTRHRNGITHGATPPTRTRSRSSKHGLQVRAGTLV
jgi:hypothetical protein